jgi:hypothetical protein
MCRGTIVGVKRRVERALIEMVAETNDSTASTWAGAHSTWYDGGDRPPGMAPP